jgi:uncharacterized repeat protein (TIGR03803 family)
VLHAFDGADGQSPEAGVVVDKKGNVYGTTYLGGADDSGAVYEVAPNGTDTVLYSFSGGSDGGYPQSSLALDTAGNLYGTTNQGGASGYGTVFKIASQPAPKIHN